MLDENVKLKLLRGKDIKIDSDISIKSYTLNEIIDLFGIDLYNKYVGSIANTPYDIRAQLYELGIIYTDLSHWDLFLNNCKYGTNGFMQESIINLLSLDIDKCVQMTESKTGREVLLTEHGNIIDEFKFKYIVGIIREMNGYPDMNKEPKFGNKASMIYEIERQIRRMKKGRRIGSNVTLNNIISSVAWNDGSISIKNIWELTLYQLYNGLNRKVKKENYNNLMLGVYTGNIKHDSVNFNKENWFTE